MRFALVSLNSHGADIFSHPFPFLQDKMAIGAGSFQKFKVACFWKFQEILTSFQKSKHNLHTVKSQK